jgi:hypothetical protein
LPFLRVIASMQYSSVLALLPPQFWPTEDCLCNLKPWLGAGRICCCSETSFRGGKRKSQPRAGHV